MTRAVLESQYTRMPALWGELCVQGSYYGQLLRIVI